MCVCVVQCVTPAAFYVFTVCDGCSYVSLPTGLDYPRSSATSPHSTGRKCIGLFSGASSSPSLNPSGKCNMSDDGAAIICKRKLSKESQLFCFWGFFFAVIMGAADGKCPAENLMSSLLRCFALLFCLYWPGPAFVAQNEEKVSRVCGEAKPAAKLDGNVHVCRKLGDFRASAMTCLVTKWKKLKKADVLPRRCNNIEVK